MEITWETERTVVLTGAAARAAAWCSQCGAVVESLSVPQAARLAGISTEAAAKQIKHGQLHALTMPSGELRICTTSLRRK